MSERLHATLENDRSLNPAQDSGAPTRPLTRRRELTPDHFSPGKEQA